MILETERLILRHWEDSDAEECYRYAKDPRVGPPAGWPPHTDIENTRQVIRDILKAPETYAIVLKETGLPVGSMGLHFHSDLAEADGEAELGYWIGVPYWGRGLVPEAGREMLRHAFMDLGLDRVWCGYYDGNDKSKRVQEKLGFRYVRTTENVPVPMMGETRKGHSNCMTKEEWQKRWGGTVIGIEEIPLSDIGGFWDLHIRYLTEDGIITDPEDIEYFSGDEYRGILEEHMERERDRQHMVWFTRGGERIGAASFCTYLEEDGKCFILDFWIFPPYRGNGTGHMCFRALERYTEKDGARWYEINSTKEDSVRFWKSLGFTENGTDEYDMPVFVKR